MAGIRVTWRNCFFLIDEDAGCRRWLFALCLLLFAVDQASTQAQTPHSPQNPNTDIGRSIGRSVAASAVLGINSFATGGSYGIDDGFNGTDLQLISFGTRHNFRAEKSWQPYIDVGVARVDVEQSITIGESDLQVTDVELMGGVRRQFPRGWFAEAGVGLEYSDVKQRLRYVDAMTAAIQGPLLDGIVVNWDANAWTTSIDLGGGHRHVFENEIAVRFGLEVATFRTDPFNTDDPLQDVSVTTGYQRIVSGVELPLRRSIRQRPLRFDARLRHTLFDSDLTATLDSSSMTDVRVDVVALRPDSSNSRIPGLGLAVTYTRADSFDGWAFGVTLAR